MTEVRCGRWPKESHRDLDAGVQGVEALLSEFGRCALKAEGKVQPRTFARAIYLRDLAQVRSLVSVMDFGTVICTLYPANFICGESSQILAESWDKVSLKSCLCQRK